MKSIPLSLIVSVAVLLLVVSLAKCEDSQVPGIQNTYIINQNEVVNELRRIANNVSSITVNFIDTTNSTQTKTGGLVIGGSITVSGFNMANGASSGYVLTSNGSGGAAWLAGAVAQSASTSNVLVNLVVTTGSVSGNEIKVTADEIDVMGCYTRNLATSTFMNLSGAGGSNLSDPAYTFVRLFVAAPANCSTFTVITDSANVSIPVLPTTNITYTKFRPIGYALNNGASNITPFFRVNHSLVWTGVPPMPLSNVNPGTTWTDIDLSSSVSPGAYAVKFSVAMLGVSLNAQLSTGFRFRGMQNQNAYSSGNMATTSDSEGLGGVVITGTSIGWAGTFYRSPFLGDRTFQYIDDQSVSNLWLSVMGEEQNY